jgi:tRNA/tmRNA/rRNA uracil-C5-methylase (TrmA/RlmC/RlmD family)
LSRHIRDRESTRPEVVGMPLELTVGAVAHGGHCVARPDDGPVVFVRHALPGERVVVEITEGREGDKFWRGDAVEVLSPSPQRVSPPCAYAGPGKCGGCDFQHVELAEQRAWKAAVVKEQFSRIAKRDVEVAVVEVPGASDGLHWRERVGWVSIPGGERGLRIHRSHQLMIVDECLLERPIEGKQGNSLLLKQVQVGRWTREFQVSADGFWQSHPGAPVALVETVLSQLRPQRGEVVLDLYAGAGLFAGFLGEAVDARSAGTVIAVEGDREAAQHGRHNLADLTRARVIHGDVLATLRADLDRPFDIVVLDPPRSGAKRDVIAQIVDRAPRAISYVACDPAALARDTTYLQGSGYELVDLQAFDLFPMTHHVECVALFEKAGS